MSVFTNMYIHDWYGKSTYICFNVILFEKFFFCGMNRMLYAYDQVCFLFVVCSLVCKSMSISIKCKNQVVFGIILAN